MSVTVTRKNALYTPGGRGTVLTIAFLKGALRFMDDPQEIAECLREMNDGVDNDVVAAIPAMSDVAMQAHMACYSADPDDGTTLVWDREVITRPSFPNARRLTDQLFWDIIAMTPGMAEALAPLKPRRLATELAASAPEREPGTSDAPEPSGSTLSPPGPNGWR